MIFQHQLATSLCKLILTPDNGNNHSDYIVIFIEKQFKTMHGNEKQMILCFMQIHSYCRDLSNVESLI